MITRVVVWCESSDGCSDQSSFVVGWFRCCNDVNELSGKIFNPRNDITISKMDHDDERCETKELRMGSMK